MEGETLTGSEQMVVILAGIAFIGACSAGLMQFILRSRCTHIKCCGTNDSYCLICEEPMFCPFCADEPLELNEPNVKAGE